MNPRFLLVLALMALSGGAIVASDCIPDGGSESVCSQDFLGGSVAFANLVECDPYVDDAMGPARLVPLGGGVYQACARVDNDGGDLSGPNGVVQNGSTEGDCIEVSVQVTVATGSSGVALGNGVSTVAGSPSGAGTVTFASEPKELCPC